MAEMSWVVMFARNLPGKIHVNWKVEAETAFEVSLNFLINFKAKKVFVAENRWRKTFSLKLEAIDVNYNQTTEMLTIRL